MFSIERLAFTVAFLLTLASPARSEMLFYASFDKSQHADFAVGNRKASGTAPAVFVLTHRATSTCDAGRSSS